MAWYEMFAKYIADITIHQSHYGILRERNAEKNVFQLNADVDNKAVIVNNMGILTTSCCLKSFWNT